MRTGRWSLLRWFVVEKWWSFEARSGVHIMRSKMSVLPVASDMWVGSLVLMIDRLLLFRMSCSAWPLEFVLLQ